MDQFPVSSWSHWKLWNWELEAGNLSRAQFPGGVLDLLCQFLGVFEVRLAQGLFSLFKGQVRVLRHRFTGWRKARAIHGRDCLLRFLDHGLDLLGGLRIR